MRSLCAGKSELDRLKRTTGMLDPLSRQTIYNNNRLVVQEREIKWSSFSTLHNVHKRCLAFDTILDIKLRLMPPLTSHHLSCRCLTRQDQNRGQYDCRCTSNQYDLILKDFSCLHTLKKKKEMSNKERASRDSFWLQKYNWIFLPRRRVGKEERNQLLHWRRIHSSIYQMFFTPE